MRDQKQAEDQAGFRKTDQTTDHLATYRLLEQKCHEWGIKMWTATVDFTKAFDSISGNKENCIANALKNTEYARRSTRGHWSFLGPGSEKNWYGTHTYNPNGKRYRVAEDMVLNFSESGHPVFRGSSALERGDLKSKKEREIVCTLLW